jgi:hypothetical protein
MRVGQLPSAIVDETPDAGLGIPPNALKSRWVNLRNSANIG